MLIITGVGRCGTSFAAKFFQSIGFNLGDVQWDKRINAGMEDKKVVAINRNIYLWYQRYGNSTCRLPRISKHILECDLDAVKDPRFTWPGVMKLWCSLRKDLKVLIFHRDFDQVMKSRKKMQFTNDVIDDREYTIDRLNNDYDQFLSVMSKNKVPYKILFFPAILDDFITFYKSINEFGVDVDVESCRKAWDEVVDKSLVHG